PCGAIRSDRRLPRTSATTRLAALGQARRLLQSRGDAVMDAGAAADGSPRLRWRPPIARDSRCRGRTAHGRLYQEERLIVSNHRIDTKYAAGRVLNYSPCALC